MKRKGEAKKGAEKMRTLRNFLVISSVLLAIFVLAGGDVSATVQKTLTYTLSQLSFSQIEGYDFVSLPSCIHMGTPGEPALPVRTFRFAIPKDTRVAGFNITVLDSEEVEGTYLIYPAQEPIILDGSPLPDFVPPDTAIYNSSEPFPGVTLRSGYEGYFAGTKIANVHFYPLQYIPADGKLFLYTSISFTLELETAEDWSLPIERRTQYTHDFYTSMTQEMVENPEQVALFGPTPQIVSANAVWACVIITSDSLAASFQPLADWNTRRGMRTTMVDLDSIYQYWPGVDNPQRIRNFIGDQVSFGTEHILLAGDPANVPARRSAVGCHLYFYYNGAPTMRTDQYYAALDGTWDLDGDGWYGDWCGVVDTVNGWPRYEAHFIDYYADLCVGRASVSNKEEAEVFVNKVLTYQQSPPLDYAEKQFLLLGAYLHTGCVSGGLFKDSVVVDLPGEPSCRRLYEDIYTPCGGTFSFDQINHAQAVRELKEGYYLTNHAGHGWWGKISVEPAPNTHQFLTTTDIDTLNNGLRYGLFFSFSCMSAALDTAIWCKCDHSTPDDNDIISVIMPEYTACFGKHWLTNPQGGGVAYIGNSGAGIIKRGRLVFSSLLDKLFFSTLFQNPSNSVGWTLQQTKNLYPLHDPADPSEEGQNSFPLDVYCLQSLNLLGDPTMPVWISPPESLRVSHPTCGPTGECSFPVQVTDSGENPVSGALACLCKDGDDVYSTLLTDDSGEADFTISPQSSGDLYVTVTKHNFLPYRGICLITEDPGEFKRGDVDGGGTYTLGDGLLLLNYIFSGSPVPSCLDAADYNDDDSITLGDALNLIYWYVGEPGVDPPAPPGTTCGYDPICDALDCIWHEYCMGDRGGLAYEPPVSMEGAPNRLVVGETEVSKDGVVVVPVDLVNSEALCGFEYTITYDPKLIAAQAVDDSGLITEKFGLFAPYIDVKAGKIKVGNVPDLEMKKMLAAGKYRVANIGFQLVVEELKAAIPLKLENAVLYDSLVNQLPTEWIDGLIKPTGGLAKPVGSSLPEEFGLSQNYPNPFNPITEIRYALPCDCRVKLEVFNIGGQRVVTLVDENQKAGYKTARWDASFHASGIYFYRLQAGDFTQAKKMILLK